MASKIKIELDEAGIREYLQSQGVQDELAARGERIAGAANANAGVAGAYEMTRGHAGKTRTRVFVGTVDIDGRVAEAHTGSLLRSLDAGR